MKTHKTVKSLLVASLLSTTASMVAVAQDEDGARSGGIEEIVITSEKRESTISDTAIAISAFDADMRDDLGIEGASDIANYTPGMTYNASPNRIFIRGVGRVDNSLGSEPGVAIYRDGIYINEAASVSDNTFFVDRIEVLRGPQGTLYGKNSIGGAASVYSKKPTDEFTGNLRLGAYNYGGQSMALALSGPITDRVRYRIAGEKGKNDGWVTNLSGAGDQNSFDFERYDVQFEFDITDNLTWWIEYNNYAWDQSATGGGGLDAYNTTLPGGHVGDFDTDFQSLVPNAALGYAGQDPGFGEVNKDDPGSIVNPGSFFTSHLTLDTEKWTFKYLYGFNQYEWDYINDYDGTARTDLQYYELISQHEEYNQHELQAISNFGGDFEVILGAFYYKTMLWQPYTLTAPNNPVLKTPVWADFGFSVCGGCIIDAPANPKGIFYDQTGDLESTSYAAYGQLDYFLNDQWHIALGGRFTKDEKLGYENQRIVMDGQGTYAFLANFFGMTWLNVATEPYGVPTPGAQAQIAWDFSNGTVEALHEDSWSDFTWSLGADYRPNDDTMLYAKVSTGYKAGGFRLGSMQPDQGVDPETLLAWEAGAKLTLGQTLQLNLATYLYEYSDMQAPLSVINDVGVNATYFLNLESANAFGFEADAQWAASENLMLFATYTYMDTEIERVGGDGAIDTADVCSLNPDLLDPNNKLAVIYNPALAAYDLPNRTGAAGGCSSDQWLGSQLSGNKLLLSPPNKFTLNGIYTWFLNEGEVSVAGSYVYQSEQFSDIFNNLDRQVPGFQSVDLRMSYRRPDDGLRISGYIRNALDEEIIESITRTGWKFNNTRNSSIRPPRTIGIEIDIEF